jgi:hypothetical protein
METALLPDLTRSKKLSVNWSGTVLPINNYQYFFAYDEEIKEGILIGIQPFVQATSNSFFFAETNPSGTNDLNNLSYGYITLVNKLGQVVVDSLPINSLFLSNVPQPNTNAGLTIRNFWLNVDPSKSYVTFNYHSGDLDPASFPSGISFTWYYKKRIM